MLPPASRTLSMAAPSGPQAPATLPPYLWPGDTPGASGALGGCFPPACPPWGLAGALPDALYDSTAQRPVQLCGSSATGLLLGELAALYPTWGSVSTDAGPARPARSAHLLPGSTQMAAAGDCRLHSLEHCVQSAQLPDMQASWATGLGLHHMGCAQVLAASERLSCAPPEWQAASGGMAQGSGQVMCHALMPDGDAGACGSRAEALSALAQSTLPSQWAWAPPRSTHGLGFPAQEEPVEQLYPGEGFLPRTCGWAQQAPEGLPRPRQGVSRQPPSERAQQASAEQQIAGQGSMYLPPGAPLQQPHPDVTDPTVEFSSPFQGHEQVTGLLEAHRGDVLQRLLARDGQALPRQPSWLSPGAQPVAGEAVHLTHAAAPVLPAWGSVMPWTVGAPDMVWGGAVLSQAVAGFGQGSAGWVAPQQ